MNLLTKICVVVLVVLILLACPVFITQATVGPNYRHAYNQQVNRNEVLSQHARHTQLALQQVKRELDEAISRAAEAQAARQREVEDMQTRLSAEQLKGARFENQLKKYNAELTELRANYAHVRKRTEQLADQLGQAREKIDEFNEENRRLSDLLKQTQSENDRLGKIARVLREQLVERDERIKHLEQQIAATGATGVPLRPAEGLVVPGAEEIAGTITALRGDLASINVGSAKGIKVGMKLIVYRGGQFVSHLRIQEVDVSQAAGIIIDRRLDPMQGDKVTTSLK